MSDAHDQVDEPRELRVGVVGLGWMGQVHARSLSRLAHHYPGLGIRPRLVVVAEPVHDERTTAAVAGYGFEERTDDWRELVARDDLDLVCVAGPNFIHRDVAVAAATSGKHLWLEKPAGRSLAETREIAAAVEAAGVHSAVGFNYRNAPAVERARALVAGGRIGTVEHTDVRFLADYAAHPDGALSWRFRNEFAGSGVLGDLVCHAADLARYVVGGVVGEIDELVADRATFIPQRPEAVAGARHFERGSGALGDVENEDYASALLRFADGSRGVLESSRVAVGEQCTYGIEVHGTAGALAWDFRRMGELRVCLGQDFQDGAWATELMTPSHGELGAFQPGTGIAMSYDDLKVIEAQRLLASIDTGVAVGATIHDAVAAAEVVEAMTTSADERRWVRP